MNHYMTNIMTINEQSEIINWANLNHHRFKPNGYARQYQYLDYLDDIPQCVWDIRERIVERENLVDYQTEPIFRDFIGYIQNGGKIHPHVDSNVGGYIHTRFNVFVQLPIIGGLPIYNGVVIPVKECEYMKCISGLYEHSCEMVVGDKARIILSFGFLIPAILCEDMA